MKLSTVFLLPFSIRIGSPSLGRMTAFIRSGSSFMSMLWYPDVYVMFAGLVAITAARSDSSINRRNLASLKSAFLSGCGDIIKSSSWTKIVNKFLPFGGFRRVPFQALLSLTSFS